jgi:hypothetical protein
LDDRLIAQCAFSHLARNLVATATQRTSQCPALMRSYRAKCKSGSSQRVTIRCWASCTSTVTMQPLRLRHDGAGAAEGGSGCTFIPQIGGIASGGFHHQRGWGRGARSGRWRDGWQSCQRFRLEGKPHDRPKVDPAMLRFPKSEALQAADFRTRDDEVVKLNPVFGMRPLKTAAVLEPAGRTSASID